MENRVKDSAAALLHAYYSCTDSLKSVQIIVKAFWSPDSDEMADLFVEVANYLHDFLKINEETPDSKLVCYRVCREMAFKIDCAELFEINDRWFVVQLYKLCWGASDPWSMADEFFETYGHF